jgi:hypothetical protein
MLNFVLSLSSQVTSTETSKNVLRGGGLFITGQSVVFIDWFLEFAVVAITAWLGVQG